MANFLEVALGVLVAEDYPFLLFASGTCQWQSLVAALIKILQWQRGHLHSQSMSVGLHVIVLSVQGSACCSWLKPRKNVMVKTVDQEEMINKVSITGGCMLLGWMNLGRINRSLIAPSSQSGHVK